MKVIHLISGRDAGGARTHVLRLLRELNRTDEADLLCLSSGALSEAAERDALPCRVISGGFFAQLFAAKKIISSGGYALVHCHGSRANVTGALLRRTLGVPVISTVHSDHRLDYLHRPLAGLVFGTLNALALRRMDALVCVSDEMRKTYAERGFRRGKLFSVYNGIDLSRVQEGLPRNEWLLSHGIPPEDGCIYTGTAARFDAVKDLPTMLRGFAKAARKDARLRLILAGSGAEEDSLRSLAESLGVADRVFFPGWVEDTDGLYAALDVCLLTSVSETFPYALTDAAAHAVPVISTAVGGVPALVEDGVNGYLIAVGDDDALAERLLTLAEDAALRSALGAALRRKVKDHFSMTAMAEKQRAIYKAVIAPRRGVIVAGAYGCGNRGDELMLSALLSDLRREDPLCSVTVLSHRPKETARRFDVDSVFYLRFLAIARGMKASRALIFGGGNLLQDATSRRSLAYYLALLRLGHRKGLKILLTGVGLGPLTEHGWKRSAAVLNECADTVVFREKESLAAALSHGIAKPELLHGADIALETDMPETEREDVLLVCPRRAEKERLYAMARAAALSAERHGWRLIFAAMNVREDAALCRCLAERFGGEAMEAPEDIPSLARLFASAQLTVTMRLHALTLSALAGTRVLGMDSDGRIAAAAEDYGCPYIRLTSPESFAAAAEAAAGMTAPHLPDELRERLQLGRDALRHTTHIS